MKYLLLFILVLNSAASYAQFHIKVTCNPANDGEINPRWLNNYVIAYTVDNWKHSFLLYDQITYEGSDNDGATFYISYWQPPTFQTQEEAFNYAIKLTTLYQVGKHQATQYQKHLCLKDKYTLALKKLNFKDAKSTQCTKEMVIK